MIELIFNCNPAPKDRPRAFYNKRTKKISTYTTAKTRNFEAFIKRHAFMQYKSDIILNEIKMSINFFIRKPKTVKREFPTVKPDLDNYIKAICDSLNGVIYKDDAQIISLTANKLYAKDKPRIVVSIEQGNFYA